MPREFYLMLLTFSSKDLKQMAHCRPTMLFCIFSVGLRVFIKISLKKANTDLNLNKPGLECVPHVFPRLWPALPNNTKMLSNFLIIKQATAEIVSALSPVRSNCYHFGLLLPYFSFQRKKLTQVTFLQSKDNNSLINKLSTFAKPRITTLCRFL